MPDPSRPLGRTSKRCLARQGQGTTGTELSNNVLRHPQKLKERPGSDVGRRTFELNVTRADALRGSDLRSLRRAENDAPRFVVLGGDSRIQASWMLYSSLNRTTALMLIQINASSFSTGVPSDRSTLVHPDRAFTVNARMIDASSSSFDPMSRYTVPTLMPAAAAMSRTVVAS